MVAVEDRLHRSPADLDNRPKRFRREVRRERGASGDGVGGLPSVDNVGAVS